MMNTCRYPNCGGKVNAKGLCSAHYFQQRDGKELLPIHRPGAKRWLLSMVEFDGEECLIWPFARMKATGRGVVSYAGRPHETARLMCRLAHGDAPENWYESAHSCGNGHLGCVNPRHLSWKTPKENAADKEVHGTVPQGERHGQAALTNSQVLAIREFAHNVSRRAIADLFGTSAANVGAIVRRQSWRHV